MDSVDKNFCLAPDLKWIDWHYLFYKKTEFKPDCNPENLTVFSRVPTLSKLPQLKEYKMIFDAKSKMIWLQCVPLVY